MNSRVETTGIITQKINRNLLTNLQGWHMGLWGPRQDHGNWPHWGKNVITLNLPLQTWQAAFFLRENTKHKNTARVVEK